MDLKPRNQAKIARLIQKGVSIPNPLSIDIDDDVDPERISSDGVVIFPGCRIQGARTVVSARSRLGAEAPVTLIDCRLGPDVHLKGGYFSNSVFLEKASLGLGAQIREGCLLEEEANGAHCVGLKQTILFPFVTLGSLINFCDCLMAGGTSRADHSEVGSSYVHFNYTPDGDKTTASLFGDVPRGVMLDQPPIFLGGQGGAVGPVRVGYGTVVAAGSILRHDVPEDGKLVFDAPAGSLDSDRRPRTYRRLTTVVRNNVLYLANLSALEAWYRGVRQPFFARQEFGSLIYEGALEILSMAREERTKRLIAMAAKVPARDEACREFAAEIHGACSVFGDSDDLPDGTDFLEAIRTAAAAPAGNYTETIGSLPPEVRAAGVQWLGRIVETLAGRADRILGSMKLFDGDKPFFPDWSGHGNAVRH